MVKKDFFKLGLLISVGAHFSLLVFFPTWRMYISPPKPKIIPVALIDVKLATKAKKAPPPPPSQKKVVEKKVAPKVLPVKITPQPSENLPVVAPRVRSKGKIRVPFPSPRLKPAITQRKIVTAFKEEKEVKKLPLGSPVNPGLPAKIPSPVYGKIPSFTPSTGTEKKGKLAITGEQESPIKFRGLGTRKIERKVMPRYPKEMEKRGIGGEGEVRVYVAPTGEVLSVELVQTSGWIAFDEEIRNTLYKWRFSPINENVVKSYPAVFKFTLKK